MKTTKKLYLFLIIMLIISFAVTGCGKKEEVVKETELSVNTVKAEKRDIAKNVVYSGIVRGKNEVYIMPKVPARVTGIFVKPGDYVSKGQTLIALDTEDYAAGAQQAQAAVEAAELQLEIARKSYERTLELHKAGAVSDSALEQAQTALKGAESGLEAAKAGLDRAELSNCMITSPINGTVGDINLSLGEMANPQAPAAVVSDTSQLEIEVMVSESEVSYIKPGSEVKVNIKAVGDKSFTGRVESVSTVPDPMKRNYTVKVMLDNEEKLIKSGMFAEVSLSTISKDGAVSVPRVAVVPKGARTVVYVVDKNKRALEKEVTVGIEGDKYVEITKGLTEGEEVITKGNTLVNNGTLVRVITGGDK